MSIVSFSFSRTYCLMKGSAKAKKRKLQQLRENPPIKARSNITVISFPFSVSQLGLSVKANTVLKERMAALETKIET